MARRNEVAIVLTAIDNASGIIGNLQRGLKQLVNPATLAAGAIAGIGLAIRNSVEVAARFETMLSNVATLGAHTAAEMTALRDGVLALGPAVGESATQLTDALYDIVSAGFSNAEALQVLEASAKAARAGLTTTKIAADAVTTALNAYGISAQDANRITDVLQVTVRRGKTTWAELGGSLGQVIPLAATAGVTWEELNAAIAAATAIGINTNQAITGLRAAISNILLPSAQARDLAEELGLSFDAATLEAEGLGGILDRVRIATGGNTEQMARLFGSVEALNTVLALTSEEGAVRFAEAQNAMANAAGAVDEAFAIQMDTLGAARAQFSAALESINISIGTLLLPALADATRAVADFLTWVIELTGPVTALQREIAGMGDTAAFAAGQLAAVTDQEALLQALDEIGARLSGPAADAWATYIAQVRDGAVALHDIPAAAAGAQLALMQLELGMLQMTLGELEARRPHLEGLLEPGGLEAIPPGLARNIMQMTTEGQLADLDAELATVAGRIAEVEGTIRQLEQTSRVVVDAAAAAAADAAAEAEERRLAAAAVAAAARAEAEARATAVQQATGIIGRAEEELTALREQLRQADTEADIVHYQRRIATAEAALAELRRLHEHRPVPTPDVRAEVVPLAPHVPGRGDAGAYYRDLARSMAHWAQLTQAAEQHRQHQLASTLAYLSNMSQAMASHEARQQAASVVAYNQELARSMAHHERLTATAEQHRQHETASVIAYLSNLRGAMLTYEAEQARASEQHRRQETAGVIAYYQGLSIAQMNWTVQQARTAEQYRRQQTASAIAYYRELSVAHMNWTVEQQRVAQQRRQQSVAETAAYYQELATAMDNWQRGATQRAEQAQQRLLDHVAGYAQVARAASDALGLGLGGAVSALESMVTSIITKDIFGAVASGINLLSELFGGLTDGVAEVDRQIRGLADGARFLSVELVRQLAVTTRVQQDNIWGWLFGATRLALDEQATQAAIEMGSDIANAIAQGIAEGGEALQQAIDDILLQAAIESAIMDSATQALIAAWVAALQAGDQAEMDRLRREFEDIANNVRRGLIDTGLLDEAPPGTSPGRGGGVQISEITGPTRDLFADLMAPLIELPVQTMLLRDIRDLIALPRPLTAPALAAGIGTLNINIHGNDPAAIARHVIGLIERKFYLQRRGAGR